MLHPLLQLIDKRGSSGAAPPAQPDRQVLAVKAAAGGEAATTVVATAMASAAALEAVPESSAVAPSRPMVGLELALGFSVIAFQGSPDASGNRGPIGFAKGLTEWERKDIISQLDWFDRNDSRSRSHTPTPKEP